jgi:hypothetical protein
MEERDIFKSIKEFVEALDATKEKVTFPNALLMDEVHREKLARAVHGEAKIKAKGVQVFTEYLGMKVMEVSDPDIKEPTPAYVPEDMLREHME